MIIDFKLLIESLPLLLCGALVTLQIALYACIIGISLGTFLGVIQTGSNRFLRSLVLLYVTFIRGTPMLIHVLVAAYVLPQIGIHIPLFWAAVLAIGFNSAAYISQIVRSGIASVGRGQIEAARVLGLTNW